MDQNEALRDLGLEPKEISAYLALLELGEATVLGISNKSGVKRPTAYLVLRSLEEKGLISRVLKDRKTLYSPQHPQKLITEANVRLKELSEIVPQLESAFNKKGGKPRVMIYEGKDQLDRAYDEMFITKGEVMYMSTITLSFEAFPRTFRKIEYAKWGPDFSARELVDESEEGRKYAERVRGPYRQVKFIPKEMLPFDVDIGIFGNKALITQAKKEYFTVAIESDEISRAFRTIFEVMWRAAKD